MVPEPVALFAEGRRLDLAQPAVPGTPLSVLARQRARPSPRACAAEHRLVSDWLTRLHGDIAAAPRHTLDGAQVVERAEEALAMVAVEAGNQAGSASLPAPSSTFLPRLRTAAAAWLELTLPVLTGHGDLGQ